MKIIEDLVNYKVGDIVKLKYGTFVKDPGKLLVSKNHLFVIVDSENVCEISSKNNKVGEQYPYNIEITDWRSAGLFKPCHVKTDCYGKVEDLHIFKYYGSLVKNDLESVLKSYSKSPHHYVLEHLGQS